VSGIVQRPFADRFAEKVVKRQHGTCWDWVGATNGRKGYGVMWVRKAKRNRIYAHRASWILHFGQIDDGMNVLHKCDRPRCVNPMHLFLGTCKDNTADARRKGRLSGGAIVPPRGAARYNAKLDDCSVRRIRAMAGRGMSSREIANEYGVCRELISGIVARRRWRHVE
jgi:hypothetical protein